MNLENEKREISSSELNKNKKNRKNFISNFLIIIALVALFFYIGASWEKGKKISQETSSETASFMKALSDPKDLFSNTNKDKPEKVDFGVFWEAWKKIDNRYVDESKLDSQERVYGAIKGMVGALDDPYSAFMDPEETKKFDTEMEGSFEGIGAELGMREGVLIVISPIDGMPAEKAGLRAGDKIFKINGELASDITIDEAVKKIRGEKGTEVTLTIVRDGDDKTQDITIVRDKIELKSVVYEKKDGGIAYIRINKFAEDTSKEFNKEAAKVVADGSKGIILDVRNNPGGYLNVAVEIASKFMPKGEVAVWEEKRDGEKSSFKTIGGDIFGEIPIVVLINEGSASASEILAGALRDNRQVKLIGEKSFGKGSVQQLEDLSDGSSLRITIAKWLTPSSKSIHEVGLEPDTKVEISEEDIERKNDAQLKRAEEELKKEMNK